MSIAHILIDGIDIFCGSYDDIDNRLSPEQTTDVNSLSIDKRRHERALTYTLINYAAKSTPKYIPLLGATILHYLSGAPYLSIPNPKNTLNSLDSINSLHSLPSFSLSHCRSGACIAFDCESNLLIGVDIEDYSDKLSKVKSKFINEVDETALNTLLTIPQSHLLLVAWTIKEAAYKAAGIDNLTLRDGITIHKITPSPNLSTPTLPHNSTLTLTLTSTVTTGNLHLHCTSLFSSTRCITLATQQFPPNS